MPANKNPYPSPHLSHLTITTALQSCVCVFAKGNGIVKSPLTSFLYDMPCKNTSQFMLSHSVQLSVELLLFSTDVTPTCAAMQSLTENARYLNCSSNDQCDTVHCIVTFSLLQSLLSMVNFTLLPCNLPPTVRLSASNESGSVVLDLVLNETQNVPLINGVILNASVFQLTKAIGFEVRS